MRWLAFVLLLLPFVLRAAPADDAFLLARDAWRAGDVARMEIALPAVAGHVLEPYARYWYLQLRIEEAEPEEIQAFLQAHEGSYLADQLRRAWLRVLGKREQWALYDAEYAKLARSELELDCYYALARVREGDLAAAEEAFTVWDAAREIPEGCQPLVAELHAAGKLDARQVWLRVRALNAANRTAAVPQTLAYLPERERPADRQLERIDKKPAAFLQQAERLNLKKRLDRELVIYAVQRLARQDVERAAQHWLGLQRHFGDYDRAYVWGQLAFRAALNHLPQALEWYGRADAAPLSDEQIEWRVRAAMRAGDWAEVARSIERLPEALRNEPVWIYWSARAMAALGRHDAAVAQYERIAGAPHFYGKLAQEELGRPLVVPQERHRPDEAELRAAAEHPGLRRAVALFDADLWLEAVREWNWAIRDMDDRKLLAVAEFARRSELWDRAIATAERTRQLHDYWLRFLAPYRERFAAQAQAYDLDEYWLLGLVRQESRFVTQARSSAGAMGLMQVMPATARWIARRMGIGYHPDRITDVDTNIALGTGYLRYVLDSLDGHPVLAAAAYNAGPNRARRWKADRELEGAIYVETIPFTETRDYVKKVMTNASFYAALYGGKAAGLKQRLGIIPPRTSEEGYTPTITGQAGLQ